MSFLSLRRVEPSAEQTGATVHWVGPYVPLMELVELICLVFISVALNFSCFADPPIILDLS